MDDEQAAQRLVDELLALVDAGLVAPIEYEDGVRYTLVDPSGEVAEADMSPAAGLPGLAWGCLGGPRGAAQGADSVRNGGDHHKLLGATNAEQDTGRLSLAGELAGFHESRRGGTPHPMRQRGRM